MQLQNLNCPPVDDLGMRPLYCNSYYIIFFSSPAHFILNVMILYYKSMEVGL